MLAGQGTQQDFMKGDMCILVDENDVMVGEASKEQCHRFMEGQPRGLLHRAFSVFLFNSKGQLLLQQRAADKVTFPNVWTNTCCSHQLMHQDPPELDTPRDVASAQVQGTRIAAVRKLKHELGIPPEHLPLKDFKFLTRLHYCAADPQYESSHPTPTTPGAGAGKQRSEVSGSSPSQQGSSQGGGRGSAGSGLSTSQPQNLPHGASSGFSKVTTELHTPHPNSNGHASFSQATSTSAQSDILPPSRSPSTPAQTRWGGVDAGMAPARPTQHRVGGGVVGPRLMREIAELQEAVKADMEASERVLGGVRRKDPWQALLEPEGAEDGSERAEAKGQSTGSEPSANGGAAAMGNGRTFKQPPALQAGQERSGYGVGGAMLQRPQSGSVPTMQSAAADDDMRLAQLLAMQEVLQQDVDSQAEAPAGPRQSVLEKVEQQARQLDEDDALPMFSEELGDVAIDDPLTRIIQSASSHAAEGEQVSGNNGAGKRSTANLAPGGVWGRERGWEQAASAEEQRQRIEQMRSALNGQQFDMVRYADDMSQIAEMMEEEEEEKEEDLELFRKQEVGIRRERARALAQGPVVADKALYNDDVHDIPEMSGKYLQRRAEATQLVTERARGLVEPMVDTLEARRANKQPTASNASLKTGYGPVGSDDAFWKAKLKKEREDEEDELKLLAEPQAVKVQPPERRKGDVADKLHSQEVLNPVASEVLDPLQAKRSQLQIECGAENLARRKVVSSFEDDEYERLLDEPGCTMEQLQEAMVKQRSLPVVNPMSNALALQEFRGAEPDLQSVPGELLGMLRSMNAPQKPFKMPKEETEVTSDGDIAELQKLTHSYQIAEQLGYKDQEDMEDKILANYPRSYDHTGRQRYLGPSPFNRLGQLREPKRDSHASHGDGSEQAMEDVARSTKGLDLWQLSQALRQQSGQQMLLPARLADDSKVVPSRFQGRVAGGARTYSAMVSDGSPGAWGEHEMDYILFIQADVPLDVNPAEVSSVRYVDLQELQTMLADPQLTWSPWFRIVAEQFLPLWWADLHATLNSDRHVDVDTIHRVL